MLLKTRAHRRWFVPLLALLALVWHPGVAKAADLTGAWEGKLAGSLRFIVHLEQGTAGSWRATADSPDQNAMGLGVDEVTVSADSLRFSMRQIGGEYAGRFNAERTEINGIWKQRGAAMPLVLHLRADGAETVAGPRRPQEPKPPFPYRAIEVTYSNPNAKGVTLAGTLTVPPGAKPAPCAVLITGSGAEDRDETVFDHKPFLVLADYLTRHGIAVLRSDDRGMGKSTGSNEDQTSEDFAGDVAAAMAFLKTRKEIDPRKIGLIGHSEGGMIASMVASREKGVAFVVMLAGPGVPGDSVLITQSFLISQSMGYPESEARGIQAVQRELVLAAKAAPDSAQITARIRAALQTRQEQIPKDQRVSDKNLDMMAEGQSRDMRSPWMRFFLAHDPRLDLAKIQCPVLALIGEKDIQISAEQNIPEIRAALRSGGNRDATVEMIPGLNHLFQTAETGSFGEYGMIQETFAPVALQKVSDWIGSRTGRGK